MGSRTKILEESSACGFQPAEEAGDHRVSADAIVVAKRDAFFVCSSFVGTVAFDNLVYLLICYIYIYCLLFKQDGASHTYPEEEFCMLKKVICVMHLLFMTIA